jgi:hypothetical protein
VANIFSQACIDLGEMVVAVKPESQALARQVLAALRDNGFGQYGGLIAVVAPALGGDGLACLKAGSERATRRFNSAA